MFSTVEEVFRFTSHRYDTAINEPSADYMTLKRMITVSDDNVFNALVDQVQIESILLIETDSLARTIMAQNVVLCFVDGTRNIAES